MTRQYKDELDPIDTPLPPERRMGLIGHEAVEARLRRYLDMGQLKNGWMICGAKSIGKATLAYRIARAYLAPGALCHKASIGLTAGAGGPERLDSAAGGTDDPAAAPPYMALNQSAVQPAGQSEDMGASSASGPAPLEVDETHPSIRQIVNRAHPDLFVLEREWQERTNRLAPQITIDQLRNLSAFFALTASTGRRVVIIDAADDLNRNAANALLKSLEEPPAQTLILLIAHAPGKILATIKSRCRKLVLTPVAEASMRAFVRAESTDMPDKERGSIEANMVDILARAQGCPGYGLALAGAEAGRGTALAGDFFADSLTAGNIEPLIEEITAKASLEDIWPHFERALLAQIARAARDCADHPQAGQTNPLPAAGAGGRLSSPPAISALSAAIQPANAIHFARYWSGLRQHFSEAAALHLDKTQLLRQIRIELGQLC